MTSRVVVFRIDLACSMGSAVAARGAAHCIEALRRRTTHDSMTHLVNLITGKRRIGGHEEVTSRRRYQARDDAD